MKIFLSGGTGMVGQAVRCHRNAVNYEIHAPTRDELDLENEEAVWRYLSEIKPDIVIHAAGLVGGIQANIANPVDFLVKNLKVGLNVVRGAQQSNVPKLLNIGSSCMYPRNVPNPLRENQILTGEFEPTNEGYAIAKVTTARLCEYIAKEDRRYCYKTIVPCNLYGPHDKFDLQSAHMIPAVIRKIHMALQEGSTVVDIWGDGKARREFMFVNDLADFIFFSVERMDYIPSYLNVGLGSDFSIDEYYREIADVLGYDGDFRHDLSKPPGMRQKLLDISLLKALGWQAKTSLSGGIQQTYEFYRTWSQS